MRKTVHIHLDELEKISGGKTDFIIRMLDTALKNTPDLLLQMKAALNASAGDINTMAHRLRPTFHYLGRTDICSLLEEIEYSASQMPAVALNEKTGFIFRESELIFEEVKNVLAELRA